MLRMKLLKCVSEKENHNYRIKGRVMLYYFMFILQFASVLGNIVYSESWEREMTTVCQDPPRRLYPREALPTEGALCTVTAPLESEPLPEQPWLRAWVLSCTSRRGPTPLTHWPGTA